MDRKVTEGVSQTLKSKTYDYGFDITADIKQSYHIRRIILHSHHLFQLTSATFYKMM